MNLILDKINAIEGLKAYKNRILNIYHVEVNGNKVLSYNRNTDGSLAVFPYAKYFPRTKQLDLHVDELIKLIIGECINNDNNQMHIFER